MSAYWLGGASPRNTSDSVPRLTSECRVRTTTSSGPGSGSGTSTIPARPGVSIRNARPVPATLVTLLADQLAGGHAGTVARPPAILTAELAGGAVASAGLLGVLVEGFRL